MLKYDETVLARSIGTAKSFSKETSESGPTSVPSSFMRRKNSPGATRLPTE
jgi:hypothetical protein